MSIVLANWIPSLPIGFAKRIRYRRYVSYDFPYSAHLQHQSIRITNFCLNLSNQRQPLAITQACSDSSAESLIFVKNRSGPSFRETLTGTMTGDG